ncbi:MAG: class I tRNA ligase family protein [Candidatus Taylorbacteria bacterium]|nr:class I tRNA ligase family protein [Candidatus Taylorbacteria bacterium]
MEKDEKSGVSAQNVESAPKAEKSKVALREEEILKFWNERQIFQKSLKKESPKGEFIIYDGPPFATGTPHYGHILAGTIKDVVPRYKTMKGYHAARRWGWDCHGLPVENLVEKELGLASKKDIEAMGIGKFNQAARDSVLRYAHIWKEMVPRTGRWVDMENDYRTMDTSYTESIWWIFKSLQEKGLVYEGFKSMHYCPHCGTTLSNFEVNQGYKDITDISVYIKFELKDEANTYLLAWTTTPWTLPGNSALAVNPEIDYLKVEIEGGKKYIFAKERADALKAVTKIEWKVLEEFKGSKLLGLSYKPVFDYYLNDSKIKNLENGWKVYGAPFVTTTDGTGIVHIAPAFGSDDYDLSLKEKIPFIQHVSKEGLFKKEVKDFAGQKVKPRNEPGEKDAHQRGDIEIIKYLATPERNYLLAKEKMIHPYPHCYRCDTPLLNYATSSWFIEVTKIKDKLVEANKSVVWAPEEIGVGRFGKWLEGARDWAVSRSRYWGAPLPVWRTEDGSESYFAGSISDLKAKMKPRNKFFLMRHGESETNIKEIHSSDLKAKYHLTEKGKDQAKAGAEALKDKKIDIIFSSPILRTVETAEIVSRILGKKEKEIKTDTRIGEFKLGKYDGKSVADYYKDFPTLEDRLKHAPEGGECYKDVEKRVISFFEEIDKKYEGKNILVITHECPAWLAITSAEGMDDRGSIQYRNENNNKDEYVLDYAGVKEMKFVSLPRNTKGEIDLHRPFIDSVILHNSKGEEMKRIPEVFDCWFESGGMPYAEAHYLGKKLDGFDPVGGTGLRSLGGLLKNRVGFPADFVAEGQDQTRGWFYTMTVLGVALFGIAPFKNVVVNGLILAEDGQKMSKSKKNYPDPTTVIDKYGMDAIRYYILSSPAVCAEDLAFSEKGVDDILKKNINRLDNVISFYEMYSKGDVMASEALNSKNILDKWILAKLKETIFATSSAMEIYSIDKATRPLAGFIEDISVWYLRRSRDRFKSDDEVDKRSALATTKYALTEFAKIMAPFMPFFAEAVYKRVKEDGGPESVHLSAWPESEKNSKEEEKILVDMTETRRIVTLGLEARAKANIKVRQPLASLKVKLLSGFSSEFLDLIKDEVNVKEVVLDENITGVELDIFVTNELREEGMARDLIRAIQEMRKKKGLNPSDLVTLTLEGDKKLKKVVGNHEIVITKVTGVKEIVFSTAPNGEIIDLGEMKIKANI